MRFELLQGFFYFYFCCQWMCFNFRICFICQHSCRYYEFCSRINICAVTAEIKMHKPIIKRKTKKHDSIVLPAKSKLRTIKILIYILIMKNLLLWIMCGKNITRWKKKSKILKMLWHVLYKSNTNISSQL